MIDSGKHVAFSPQRAEVLANGFWVAVAGENRGALSVCQANAAVSAAMGLSSIGYMLTAVRDAPPQLP